MYIEISSTMFNEFFLLLFWVLFLFLCNWHNQVNVLPNDWLQFLRERERIALSSKKKLGLSRYYKFFFKPFQLFVWTNEALKHFVYILVLYIILWAWGQTKNANPIFPHLSTQLPYLTISFCVLFFYNQLAKKYELPLSFFFCKQKCITYKIASTTYVQCLLFQVWFLKKPYLMACKRCYVQNFKKIIN